METANQNTTETPSAEAAPVDANVAACMEALHKNYVHPPLACDSRVEIVRALFTVSHRNLLVRTLAKKASIIMPGQGRPSLVMVPDEIAGLTAHSLLTAWTPVMGPGAGAKGYIPSNTGADLVLVTLDIEGKEDHAVPCLIQHGQPATEVTYNPPVFFVARPLSVVQALTVAGFKFEGACLCTT